MTRMKLKIVDIFSQMMKWQNQQQTTTTLLIEIAIRIRKNNRTNKALISENNNFFSINSIARLKKYEIFQSINQQILSQNSNTICIKTKMHSYESCKSWCNCCCHIQQFVRFSRVLKNVIKSLFIEYSSIFILTTSCNEKMCLKRSSPFMHVSYYFSAWFFFRVLYFTVFFNAFKKSQMILHISRMIDWTHSLWRLTHFNHVIFIQNFFFENLASSFDVNAYDQSALHVCWIFF